MDDEKLPAGTILATLHKPAPFSLVEAMHALLRQAYRVEVYLADTDEVYTFVSV